MAGTISKSQVTQLASGFAATLAKVDANVSAQVWAETLPIVGDNLKAAAAGGAAPLHTVQALGDAVKSALDTLAASGSSFTDAQVQSSVNAALAAKGYGGIAVTADFSAAGDLKLTIAAQHANDTVSVDVEHDLGLKNLGLQTSGSAQTTLKSDFSISAGLDANGFYVSTGADTKIGLDADTRLPGFSAAATLGGLSFSAANSASSPTVFTGNFDVTLKDGNGDGKLRSGELAGDLVDAVMSGSADMNIDLTASVPAGSAMPKLSTVLSLDWNFSDAAVNPNDDNSGFGSLPTLSLTNTKMNLGSFFNGLAGQVLHEISDVTAPLKPVIDILTTPIPILSDLGSSKVTLLDFAGLSADETAAIEGLADIIKLSDKIASFGDASNITIDLGTAGIDGDLRSMTLDELGISMLRDPYAFASQNADLGSFLADVAALGGGGLSFPLLSDPTTFGRMLLGQNVDLFDYQASLSFSEEFAQFFPVLGPLGVKLGGKLGVDADFDFGFDVQGIRDYVAGGMSDPSKIFDGFYVRAVDDAGNPVTGFKISAGVIAGLEANVGIASVGVDGDLTADILFALDQALADDDGKVRGVTLVSTPIGQLFDPSGELTSGLHAYIEFGYGPFSIDFSFDSPRVVLLNFDGDKKNPPILASELAGGELALNIGPRSAERKVGNLKDTAEKIFIDTVTDAFGAKQLMVEGFKFKELHVLPGSITGNGGAHSDEIILTNAVTAAAILSGGDNRDVLTGGAGNDTLNGDNGPDVLNGNDGRDKLFGGAASDKLIGGKGNDQLDGGDGLDTASYETAAAGMTIDLRTMTFTGDGAGDSFVSIERYEGTNFKDTITGDNSDNSMLGGLDGDDVIQGLGGKDQLEGGKGADKLSGGAGDDMLLGGEGADALNGGDGTDAVAYADSKAPVSVSLATGIGTGGDAAGDVLTSIEILIGAPLPFGDLSGRINPITGKVNTKGTGDYLEGNDAANTISGLGGADYIVGGAGADTLYGDSADATARADTLNAFDADTLKGGLGNDKLYGQEGNDDLDGEEGQDTLDGGQGDDHLRTLDLASIDKLDGGAGYNRLSADYSDKTVAINWIVGQKNDYTFADGDSEKNFQTLGELDTADKADKIVLDGTFDDAYDNIIRTNGGNDIVRSGRGDDRVEGGSGNDRIEAGAQGDYVDAGAGNDYVNGGSNDVKLVFDFWGSVTGFEGKADELHGGKGNDTVSFDQLQQTVTYIGIGTDGGKQFGLGVDVDLSTNTTGRAAIGIKIDGFENIIGTNYADSLIGDDNDNIFQPLRGGGQYSGSTGGPDRIDGRGGIDTLVIDFSLADLAEAAGVYTNGTSISRITLDARAGVDSYMYSNIERLNITGASKNDTLYAWVSTPDNDILKGMGGNDQIGGNGGSDLLEGGDGDDRISAQGTFDMSYNGQAGGRDIINGGAGDDFIEDIAFAFNGPTLAADALFKLDGGAGYDIVSADFSNQTKNIVWSSAAPADLSFAGGAYMKNFEQIRYFATGSGNDTLTQLGRFENSFYLGAGDDTVNSGMGRDTIRAGDGTDTAIVDFSQLDTPDLNGAFGGGGNAYYRTRTADNVYVDYLEIYQVEKFVITGTSKNDGLGGYYGDDVMSGGLGDDTLSGFFGGNDTIDGGDGNDTITGSRGDYGSGGNDLLTGGSGDDIIRSLTGNDTISGGGGKDTITADFDYAAGFGTDRISGGAGDDVISDISSVNGETSVRADDRLMLDGGDGTDMMSADFGNQTVDIVFVSGTSNSLDFADGSYFRNFEGIGAFVTGSGNDTLTQLGRVNNTIATRDGNDTVNAGSGIDVIYAGAGDDLLIVDYSKDDGAGLGGVHYEDGALVRRDLATNAVVDSLRAYQFERFIFTGGSKGDQLSGDFGNDTLKGSGGADWLAGRGGADTIDGGSGLDVADYSDKYQEVSVKLDGANTVTVKVNGVAEDTIRNVEGITGGSFADILTGDGLNNSFTGGVGADTLTGGAGKDSFIYNRLYEGGDRITDFVSGSDSIVVSALYFGGGLVAGSAAKLTVAANFASVDSSGARFIYDTGGSDYGLYFDADGGSGSNATLIAKLVGVPAFTAGDIDII